MKISKVIPENLSDCITLNNGVKIPLYGLGTSMVTSPQDLDDGLKAKNAVKSALAAGFRLIDTAQRYRTEKQVGIALSESDIAREEVFIVSKVMWDCHGAEMTQRSLMDSLKQLQVSYVDLYLIHAPFGGKIVETYKTLLQNKEKGLIRAVGVSNFGIHHLEGLKAAGLPPPTVNQIELNPWQQHRELVEYCWNSGIAPMGYCPLGRAKKFDEEPLLNMSARLQMSIPSILLRHSLQKGYITIPKSTSPKNICENAKVLQFNLTDDDMNILDNFPEWSATSWSDPTKGDWTG